MNLTLASGSPASTRVVDTWRRLVGSRQAYATYHPPRRTRPPGRPHWTSTIALPDIPTRATRAGKGDRRWRHVAWLPCKRDTPEPHEAQAACRVFRLLL